MMDSEAMINVGRKSAQAGYSEAVLNRTFYKIDIERTSCLYVLPNAQPDASVFSADRFDCALELSEHLGNMFSEVKNVGHKRAGTTSLYVRGSNSRGGLKSIPVGFLVLDEYDEMCQENIPLAFERLSGQFKKQIWEISTPTVPAYGINLEFLKSTQEHFFFKCPSCSKRIELNFDNMVITAEGLDDPRLGDSYYKCLECGNKLSQEREAKQDYLGTGLWEPTVEGADPDIRGFYVNQMYSSTITPKELARSYMLAQLDPDHEQEFYNSKMGLPHIVDGAKLSMDHFPPLICDYKKTDPPPRGKLITMGVDQGKKLHYEIDLWYIDQWGPDLNARCKCRVLNEGWCTNFEDLDLLMRTYNVAMCVIDANPETRKALEFALRFLGSVRLNYYTKGAQGRNIKFDPLNVNRDHKINVDRTSWMDTALGRFYTKRIELPKDTSFEYKSHLIEPTRIYQKDQDGNNVGRYVNTKPDHFAHARTYAEIALPLAAARTTNKNIEVYL